MQALSGLSGLSGICGGAAWSPASLTGLAPTLLPALSRTQGKLWQDSAKTVPATAAGDPVRVATCPFLGVDYTAPSDAARPLLWDEGGGLWSLLFDGVDDALRCANGQVYSQPNTVGAAMAWLRSGSGLFEVAFDSDNTTYHFYARSNAGNTHTINAGSEVNGSAVSAAFATVTAYFSGAASYVRRNGSSVLTGNPGTAALRGIRAGEIRGGGVYANMRMAGLIPINTTLADADRDSLEAYLTALRP